MDVIALHQAGFTNAVAALGTSFTADHARLLARYADEVVLIFDSDSAGQKGAQRAIGLLRETGLHIRVVTVPDGKDPDEFIKKNGPERFKLLLEKSANDVEYRLMELGRRHILTTADGRVAYLRDAAQILAELQNPVERDVYAGKLAGELSVSKEALLEQVRYLMEKRRKQQKDKQMSAIVRKAEGLVKKANPEAAAHVRAASAEEAMLGLLLLNPDLLPEAGRLLSADEMVTPFNQDIYRRLLERQAGGQPVELGFLAGDVDEEGMGYLSRMVRDARERAGADPREELRRYAGIIREENQLLGLDSPAELTPEQIQEKLRQMRERKR